jgi:predicted methyltransferase
MMRSARSLTIAAFLATAPGLLSCAQRPATPAPAATNPLSAPKAPQSPFAAGKAGSSSAASNTPAAPPETAAPRADTEKQRPTSTPYTGDLSIFETPGRDQRLQIDRVMKLMHIEPGTTVADIGAGSGWFTVRAARRVAPNGHLLAEDINPAAIRYIHDRAEKERLTDVQTIQGTPDDPNLPAHAVNSVMLMKVYHEIARPVPFMRRLRSSLAPGALVAIIDRNGNGQDHGLNRDVVEREMHEAGYRVVSRYDFTKADGQDYFLIFKAE